jgi:hypothetical protein
MLGIHFLDLVDGHLRQTYVLFSCHVRIQVEVLENHADGCTLACNVATAHLMQFSGLFFVADDFAVHH